MKKTCAWCHKPTNLPEVFAAESPILEWFEKRTYYQIHGFKVNKALLKNMYNKHFRRN